MIVREYMPSDKSAVEKLHRDMGMDYKFPDIESPLFIVRKVYEIDGKIVGTHFLRLQAEAYLMLNPSLGPLDKTRVIAKLSREVEQEALNQGIDTLCAYIPDDISKKFTKRLNLLGWETARKNWVTWFREL